MDFLFSKQLNKKISYHLELFYNITSLHITYYDENYNILNFNDKNKCCELSNYLKCEEECKTSIVYGANQSIKLGEPFIYFTPCGLSKIIMAIVQNNIFQGCLVINAFHLNSIDLGKLKASANYKNSENKDEIVKCFESNSVVSVDKVKYIIDFLIILTKDILEEERLYFKRKKELYLQNRIIGEKVQELKNKGANNYPIELEEELAIKIKLGDLNGAKNILNQIIGFIVLKNNIESLKTKFMIIELLVVMSRAAIEAGANYDLVNEISYSFYEKTYYTENNDEKNNFQIYSILTELLGRFIDAIKFIENKKAPNLLVLKEAISYVNENYNKQLTLNEVAGHINLNSQYFSRLFHKETGLKFTEYLNKVRTEESKKYLSDFNYSLINIAGLVGFSDQSYFSYVFKKFNKMTPGEYRKRFK